MYFNVLRKSNFDFRSENLSGLTSLIENNYRFLKILLMGGVGMTPSQYLFVCLGGNSSAKI